MKSDFFYSKSTGLYVARNALRIDSRVKKAVEENKIEMSWDDEGRVNQIDYDNARKLLEALGSLMLGPIEYWKVLKDAQDSKDQDMVESLISNQFCEPLDRVYLIDKTWIDNPVLLGDYKYSGKKEKSVEPIGRPGWFNPENNIDYEKGIPKKVRPPNEYGNPELWRYWGPDADLVIPTRSYIFLLKQPCWDGKFHIEDSFPNLGIRPCCKEVKPPKVKISSTNKKLSIQIEKEGDIINYSWKK